MKTLMLSLLGLALFPTIFLPARVRAAGSDIAISNLQVVYRFGQTFLTWKDAAEAEAGAKYRYSVYRSDQPITHDNFAQAELCYHGVLPASAKLYGSAFNWKNRLDPTKPYAIIEDGGKPLAPWSGLAVVTIRKAGKSHYAVVLTDEKHKPVGKIEPGRNATMEPVEEKVEPIQAIKLHDSKERKGPYVASTSITAKKGLPLHVTLHGSQSGGGGAGEYGDYYVFFGTPDMGYRDGLPGVFAVEEHRGKNDNRLLLRVRDAVEHPSGNGAMETYWFGYAFLKGGEPRFYPFTETRTLWTMDWVAQRYAIDRERVTVGGSSSGAVGSMNVGFRHPERFAAVYPAVGRVRRVPAISLEGKLKKGQALLMADGKTLYEDYVDGPRFAAGHPADLPFLGWACGRRDGYATWQEHIDMVKAMTANRHGFAFAWNNGDHSGGGQAMQLIQKYYPAEKFARNRSYPAFSHSSLDDNMGNGDPKDGDLEGGINLGFDWKEVVDEPGRWSVTLSNDRAKKDVTVDVTPRRCQQFKPRPGAKVRWRASSGGEGTLTVDRHGLATVPRVVIQASKATQLFISVP